MLYNFICCIFHLFYLWLSTTVSGKLKEKNPLGVICCIFHLFYLWLSTTVSGKLKEKNPPFLGELAMRH